MSIKPLMTAAEFWALPEIPGKRFELARGEVVETPSAGGQHGALVRLFLRTLDPFVLAHDLGEVFADGVGYVIDRAPDVVRVPDVSFVARARLAAGSIPVGFIPFAPDLAVEIVSPNDRAEDVYGKVQEYLAAGTRLMWVGWPKFRSITVYTTGEARELREGDELTGGAVIPGFRARVADLLAAV